ncbi:MAG: ArsA family ATPase, partial [Thermoproteota archaeon]|nr:ArsA family ATPase [Thermoproteota archaeon]
ISSDPAHTLSDALSMNIGNELSDVLHNLMALEIDPIIEMHKNYDSFLSYIASTFYGKGVSRTMAYEIGMLPGMTQLFSLLKIEQVLTRSDCDVVVLDMPASGEALRFLHFPKLAGSLRRNLVGLGGLLGGVARMFQPLSGYSGQIGSFLNQEADILKRLENLGGIMSNPLIASLRLVTNTDMFSLKNAKRALMSASLFGINVDLVLINKVDKAHHDTKKISENIPFDFYPVPCRMAELREKELQGIQMLRDHALEIFGDSDPSNVFFQGKVYALNETSDSITVTVRLPFVKESDVNVMKDSDELIITARHETGYVANTVMLPLAAIGMKLYSSRLNGNELSIVLVR